ncbi:MAG: PAS domain-containing protein [Epsilonproteobacteria bacterium]|nr:PAS domain-containing protein [Campylobacterota bacterium]
MNQKRIEEKLKSGKRLSKLDAPTNIRNDEKIMKEDDFIVSKTDTKGFITYCNRIFVDMAGWSRHELIGANHNIIRHPDMPKIAFKVAWDLISSKQEFFGFVKNLRKDGGFYWVLAYITADVDTKGNIVGYTSFRKKPSRTAIETLSPIYKALVDAERSGGMQASYQLLKDTLKATDENIVEKYHELVFTLQKG